MSADFRARDGVLAGYYLAFLTLNWFSPALLDAEGAVAFFTLAGVLSVIVVVAMQSDRTARARFNPLCFGAFLLLMLATVAADLWIASRFL
ncbi:MAG TPA: hypothetical protein VF170_15650 [Planctomycetaceae bacterium]